MPHGPPVLPPSTHARIEETGCPGSASLQVVAVDFDGIGGAPERRLVDCDAGREGNLIAGSLSASDERVAVLYVQGAPVVYTTLVLDIAGALAPVEIVSGPSGALEVAGTAAARSCWTPWRRYSNSWGPSPCGPQLHHDGRAADHGVLLPVEEHAQALAEELRRPETVPHLDGTEARHA
jgi:hypothetical protein